MKVLVLGSTNYIGKHVVEQLSLAGHSVTAVIGINDDDMFFFKKLNVETIKNDEKDTSLIIPKLRDIDVICNCISYELLHSEKISELNTEILNTNNLIRTAAVHNINKFIHLSSTLIYELDPLNNIAESYTPKIKNELQYKAIYWEKVIKNLCKENNISSIILRPANPIGPGDKSSFFTRLLVSHDKNIFPIIDNGDAKISLIDVRDIGRAMEWLVRKSFTDQHIFLLKGFDSTWIEIKKQIDLCVGKSSNVIYLNRRLNEEEMDKYGLTPFSIKIFGIDRVWDDSKIRGIGFKPIFSLADAINGYFNNLRNN